LQREFEQLAQEIGNVIHEQAQTQGNQKDLGSRIANAESLSANRFSVLLKLYVELAQLVGKRSTATRASLTSMTLAVVILFQSVLQLTLSVVDIVTGHTSVELTLLVISIIFACVNVLSVASLQSRTLSDYLCCFCDKSYFPNKHVPHTLFVGVFAIVCSIYFFGIDLYVYQDDPCPGITGVSANNCTAPHAFFCLSTSVKCNIKYKHVSFYVNVYLSSCSILQRNSISGQV